MSSQQQTPSSSSSSSKPQIERSITVHKHDWSYAHLKMRADPPYTSDELPSPAWPPDILTWQMLMMSALTQFGGVYASAISVDILHLDGDEAWVRMPYPDRQKFGSAVSGYVGMSDGRSVGFQVMGISNFLMELLGQQAEEAIWKEE